MDEKYFNRFKSLKRSLDNLALSCNENVNSPFVLPATAQNFNLTFDLSWKVMKELAQNEFGLTEFSTGSPRETLRTAFSLGLIHDDKWLEMLRVRNTLAHDYDGEVALKYFETITTDFFYLMKEFVEQAEGYYDQFGASNT